MLQFLHGVACCARTASPTDAISRKVHGRCQPFYNTCATVSCSESKHWRGMINKPCFYHYCSTYVQRASTRQLGSRENSSQLDPCRKTRLDSCTKQEELNSALVGKFDSPLAIASVGDCCARPTRMCSCVHRRRSTLPHEDSAIAYEEADPLLGNSPPYPPPYSCTVPAL